ncbi:MAG: hypothetical protein ILO34_00765 [Kiritimatiellae bacterium]|nr:hypothetical protein [Kiritimatiellia bacterium]
MKESQECGEELSARVSSLEEELKRLPQSAAEIADAQAAAYSIMTSEAEELAKILELEKRESEEFRRRSQERMDRLSERRCDLLRRAGASVEDMTRKALGERPEDPRTTMLRKELEDLRRLGEKKAFDDAREIMSLKEQLRDSRALAARRAEQDKDAAQLRAEIEDLRSKLQIREKDLVAERQKCETLRQQQALNQQALMARLASLESPSIGTTSSIETNQSREAKLVKLPGWMRLKK